MQRWLCPKLSPINVPRKSSTPSFVSNLTNALPFFRGSSYSLSFFESEFHVSAGIFLAGVGKQNTTPEEEREALPRCWSWASYLFSLQFLVSPCTNRLNTWIMPSSGLEYTYITYPFLTNQPDTFLCQGMVPKQTLSVHLISRFVGSAWQSCYILFNNREQQPWLGSA